MSTALQINWIRNRVLSREPRFPCLITAAIFGVDCDAGLFVQVPCTQRPGESDLVSKLLAYLYLCPVDLPDAADEEVDLDDSVVDYPFEQLRWKLPKGHKKFKQQIASLKFESILGLDGQTSAHLENPFTLFYVKQARAQATYPRNELVAKLARKHYPPRARAFHGGVLVVKNRIDDHKKVTHITQEDMSVIRVLVGRDQECPEGHYRPRENALMRTRMSAGRVGL
ncbi:hypothetical protein BJ138DRAFT_1105808 [Hygrophoropsis aurantiaca]|uniref:Uncharacterized protein n=1 Tax=Hygrophoropsis aurantiaca TaxID=72124 RepID=A0ACB7ZX46_9AGAM|nr:hypothetical protein BJ138DRAFT_1105808 [Hygrophoropsis aurantiaca]